MKNQFQLVSLVLLLSSCTGSKDQASERYTKDTLTIDSCEYGVNQSIKKLFDENKAIRIDEISSISELRALLDTNTVMIGTYPVRIYKGLLYTKDTTLMQVDGQRIEYYERESDYYENRRRPEYGSDYYVYFSNADNSVYEEDWSHQKVASTNLLAQIGTRIQQDFVEAPKSELRYREIILEYPFEPTMELISFLSLSLAKIKSAAIDSVCAKKKQGNAERQLRVEKLIRIPLVIVYDHKPW
jgi:hypothetical protein